MQVLPDPLRPPTKMNFTAPSSVSLMAVFASLRSIPLRKELSCGCIDFFIPSTKWGIGLLHDGSKLEGRGSRFLSHGAYVALVMSSEMMDYIILDFRSAPPKKAHTRKISFCTIWHQTDTKYLCEDIPKLYHVVFRNNPFNHIMILNNTCKLEMVMESALSEN
jgi:hypothetical protein